MYLTILNILNWLAQSCEEHGETSHYDCEICYEELIEALEELVGLPKTKKPRSFFK